eukprot:1791712-Lingulodinium_polyedra.AAC.1
MVGGPNAALRARLRSPRRCAGCRRLGAVALARRGLAIWHSARAVILAHWPGHVGSGPGAETTGATRPPGG